MAQRQRAQREPIDYGPPERLARGEVIVEGDVRPRGRALSIVDELGPELRGAVALVLRLFEAAEFSGYSLPSFEWMGSSSSADRVAPSARAEAARRRLAAIERHVGPLMWSTITDLLLWGKSAEAWAFECRGRGYRLDRRAAKAALICAMDAIASMKPPRRRPPNRGNVSELRIG